jgi:hypothetical protein
MALQPKGKQSKGDYKKWHLSSFGILRSVYEGCPEIIQPFWISREAVAWPWCNLAASQRRPYCASVNSHSPVGLVSRQWDAVDRACVPCDRRIHSDRTGRSASSWQFPCPLYGSREGFFWQSITPSRSLSPSTVQIWLTANSGFSQNQNRRWKGGDLWMQRSHSTQAQSTASHCRLTSLTGEWLIRDIQ